MRTEGNLKMTWILLLLATIASLYPAYADMMENRDVVLDFTNREQIIERAKWSDPQYVVLTEKGLSLVMDERDGVPPGEYHKVSRDIWIETTDPIAVGWSWRPVYSMHIRAERFPSGEFTFGENSVAYPSGTLYVRYSPDSVHWSTWQAIDVQAPKDKTSPRQIYSGIIGVPNRERAEYSALTSEYSKKDVPWKSDEEAAVKWILETEPDFFEQHLPFIGYVQFLYEVSLRGDESIQKLDINLNYGAGGMHSIPKDKEIYEDHKGPWRFKAKTEDAKSQPNDEPAAKQPIDR